MSSQPALSPPAERLPSLTARFVSTLKRSGPTLLGESVIFWFVLLVFQFLGYGGRPGGVNGPSWYLVLTFLMALTAMGAGEARFKLNRRVWTVAGINDAIAVGLAVTEATILVTFANFLMPDGGTAFTHAETNCSPVPRPSLVSVTISLPPFNFGF